MIDPIFNGQFEICQSIDKLSIIIKNITEQEWFFRYPWPTQVDIGRGNTFIGQDITYKTKGEYDIKTKPITLRNLQEK